MNYKAYAAKSKFEDADTKKTGASGHRSGEFFRYLYLTSRI